MDRSIAAGAEPSMPLAMILFLSDRKADREGNFIVPTGLDFRFSSEIENVRGA
jgi:hypothetical protein